LAGGAIDRAALDRLAQAFHERHRATYGHASPDEPVQMVNLRVSALGRQAPLDLARAQAKNAAEAPVTRPVYFKETKVAPCEVVARDGLTLGASRSGPLIVEAPDTTIVVPPGWRLSVDAGSLIALERAHA
jgi:N-methylhydantoinase A